MSQPPPRQDRHLTIVGMPAFRPEEEPFPLTPYRDVHVYTPSHARERVEPTRPVFVERTSVMLPPPPAAPRTTAPPHIVDPSLTAIWLAIGLVCLLTAAIVAGLF